MLPGSVDVLVSAEPPAALDTGDHLSLPQTLSPAGFQVTWSWFSLLLSLLCWPSFARPGTASAPQSPGPISLQPRPHGGRPLVISTTQCVVLPGADSSGHVMTCGRSEVNKYSCIKRRRGHLSLKNMQWLLRRGSSVL